MSELDQRVSLQVLIQDVSLTRPGFGVLAIFHRHGLGGERVQTFLDLEGVKEVFPAYHPVGKFAEAFFSQEYTPEKVKVVEILTGETAGEAADAALVVDSDFYALGLPGDDATDQAALASWAAANKRLLIYATQDEDAPTSATTDIGYALKLAGNNRAAGYFTKTAGFEFSIDTITVVGTVATATHTSAGDLGINDGDTFGIWSAPVGDLLGVYTVTNAGATSFDFTVPVGTSSAASTSKAWLNFNRVDAAIAGRKLPANAGSETWDMARLSGVTVDSLTGTEQTFLGSKNYNWFTSVAGANVTGGLKANGGGGKAHGGRYIDVQRGADWLETNLQLDIFQLMVNEGGQLGYDAIGFQKVETTINIRLDDGLDKGFLTPFVSGPYSGKKYVVIMPSLASIPQADKTKRLLQGIKIHVNIRGKIHNVAASITLST